MKINYCDALVIGGGLAGLRVALKAKKQGLSTIVISLVPVKRSHSSAAQGGMQASLANSKMGQGDNEDVHFADTVKGSDWGCDQEVARMFVNTAPKAIRELAKWGVPWTRIKKGKNKAVINTEHTFIQEDENSHGLIASRDFGGTKKWRTCYTADATGHSMLYTVANESIKHDINIQDRKEMISLICEDNRCYGAIVRDLIDGGLEAYVSKGTCISSGGYGRVYKTTTNAIICEGTAQATAMQSGAYLANMEAVQFHPTPIVPSGILLTEGCRGDGGVLRDKNGKRFMPDYEPEKKDLASRDVVSRRMMEHIKAGNGVKSEFGEHLWLDISILGREHIEKNLRDVQDIAKTFNNIDPADKGEDGWLPVRPAQHYSMGGIRVDKKGHSLNIKGLFSCGESACWDLHGFNRLGGNSVAEAVVSGMIVGEYFTSFCKENDIDISTKNIKKELDKQHTYIQELLSKNGNEDIFKIKKQMQEIMDEYVGVFRNKKDLTYALKSLQDLLQKSKNISIKNKQLSANPQLEECYRVPKMLKLAICITYGALLREESRGAHFREDFIKRDDENWLKRTLATWSDENALLPDISYEDIDIMKMEMPPGFRGYGAKNMIKENIDTQKRQKQVDEIVQKMKAENKSRYEIQNELLKYDLPVNYKEKNQRAGIDYE